MTHALYLVPAPLSQVAPGVDLLPAELNVVRNLRHWLVETPKTARAWLKLYDHPEPISSLSMVSVSDFANPAELSAWLEGCGADVGVMSDAGCPGVADPGATAAMAAHALGWSVRPMIGPSSLLLGLMGSGLSGQQFVFHGYLPVDVAERARFIAESERHSARLGQTQMAIETPYRNAALMAALCETLSPDTRLCVASEIRGPGQIIRTQSVSAWRKALPELGKAATLFMWLAQQGFSAGAGARKPHRSGSRQR